MPVGSRSFKDTKYICKQDEAVHTKQQPYCNSSQVHTLRSSARGLAFSTAKATAH